MFENSCINLLLSRQCQLLENYNCPHRPNQLIILIVWWTIVGLFTRRNVWTVIVKSLVISLHSINNANFPISGTYPPCSIRRIENKHLETFDQMTVSIFLISINRHVPSDQSISIEQAKKLKKYFKFPRINIMAI